MEGDVIITQDLVLYDIVGEDASGRLIGRHRSTGIGRPRFWERARYYGEEKRLAAALDAMERVGEDAADDRRARRQRKHAVNSAIAGAVLASVAAGGLAYVFVYPLLSGEARAEKRQKALVGAEPDRRIERASRRVNRRDQVAQSLKELEAAPEGPPQGHDRGEDRAGGADLDEAEDSSSSAASPALVLGLVLLVSRATRSSARAGSSSAGSACRAGSSATCKKRRIKRFLEELAERHRRDRARHPVRPAARRLHAHDRRRGRRSRCAASSARSSTRRRSAYRSATRWRSCIERVPVAEANFFGIVIAIQQKAGGNLSEALGNLSRVLRDRRKMARQDQGDEHGGEGLGGDHRLPAVHGRHPDLPVEPELHRAPVDDPDRQDRARRGWPASSDG